MASACFWGNRPYGSRRNVASALQNSCGAQCAVTRNSDILCGGKRPCQELACTWYPWLDQHPTTFCNLSCSFWRHLRSSQIILSSLAIRSERPVGDYTGNTENKKVSSMELPSLHTSASKNSMSLANWSSMEGQRLTARLHLETRTTDTQTRHRQL